MSEFIQTNPLRGSPLPVILAEQDIQHHHAWAEALRRFGNIYSTVAQAAAEIQGAHPYVHPLLELYPLNPPNSFIETTAIWTTVHPESIYTFSTAYHVGSSLALDALCREENLLPPAIHYFEKTRTHRGLGLSTMAILLEAAGEDPGGKDASIWAGLHVDPEQISIEHYIAQLGETVNDRITELFFVHSQKSELLEIHPTFIRVLEMLSRGQKPTEDREASAWIDTVMQSVFRYCGIRFTWYKMLASFLRGEAESIYADSCENLTDVLLLNELDRYHEISKSGKRYNPLPPPQAVVLELNLSNIFDQVLQKSPYLFVPGYSPRDADEIVSLPFITIDALRRVFAWEPNNIQENTKRKLKTRSIPLLSVEAIPSENLLDPRQNARLDVNSLSPVKSICSLRYPTRKERQAKWRERLEAKLMAPLVPFRIFPFGSANFQANRLYDIFGEQLLRE